MATTSDDDNKFDIYCGQAAAHDIVVATFHHFSLFNVSIFFFLLFVLSSVVIVKIVQWNNNIDNNALFNAQIKGCHLSNYLIFYLCTEIRRKNTHSWIAEKG